MLDEVYGREINTDGRMSMGVTWNHTFSPTFLNELLLSGRRIAWFGGNYNPGERNYVDEMNLPNPFGVTSQAAPQFTSLGLTGYEFRENTWKRHAFNNLTFDDNATKIIGKHEIQFGAHYRYDQLNILPDQTWPEGLLNFDTSATALYDPASTPTQPIATQLTGSNLANMFLGYANYQNLQNRRWFYLRGGEYGLYLQDNIKVTSRLTVNLGLRWEYWPAYSEKHGSWTSFNPKTYAVVLGTDIQKMYALGDSLPSLVNRYKELGLKFESYQEAGLPRNFTTTSKRDFGPRFGAAYRLGDGRASFVIRGGYSKAYFPIPMWTFVDRMFVNAPTNASYHTRRTTRTSRPTASRIICCAPFHRSDGGELPQRNRSRQGDGHQRRRAQVALSAGLEHPELESVRGEGHRRQHRRSRPLYREPRQQSRSVLQLQRQSSRLRLVCVDAPALADGLHQLRRAPAIR
jgi:hypothetical protein